MTVALPAAMSAERLVVWLAEPSAAVTGGSWEPREAVPTGAQMAVSMAVSPADGWGESVAVPQHPQHVTSHDGQFPCNNMTG